MDRFILIIIAAVIIFSALTYLLHRITFRRRYIKYLLPIFTLSLSLYYFYQASVPSEGFSDLGSFLIAFILFTCFLSSLVSGIFLDFIFPKLKKK